MLQACDVSNILEYKPSMKLTGVLTKTRKKVLPTIRDSKVEGSHLLRSSVKFAVSIMSVSGNED